MATRSGGQRGGQSKRGGQKQQSRGRRSDMEMESAMGASDATSGGGMGSGTPDAETGMRAEKQVRSGDVQKDREKLFPGTGTRKSQRHDMPKGQ